MYYFIKFIILQDGCRVGTTRICNSLPIPLDRSRPWIYPTSTYRQRWRSVWWLSVTEACHSAEWNSISQIIHKNINIAPCWRRVRAIYLQARPSMSFQWHQILRASRGWEVRGPWRWGRLWMLQSIAWNGSPTALCGSAAWEHLSRWCWCQHQNNWNILFLVGGGFKSDKV